MAQALYAVIVRPVLRAVQRMSPHSTPYFAPACPQPSAHAHNLPSCNAPAGEAATGDLLANGAAARACLTTLARLSHWRQQAGSASEGALPLAAWAAAMHNLEDDSRCDSHQAASGRAKTNGA